MAMHSKHAFITFLLAFTATTRITVVSTADIPEYPICLNKELPVEKPANFLFMIDNMIGEELLPSLRYLLRSIACYVPDDPRVENLAILYSETQHVPSQEHNIQGLIPEFYRSLAGDNSPVSSPCERFKRALGRAPATFLEKPNVQFMVPIMETENEEPNCFVKAFQNQYRDHPLNDQFYFNGILIGANISEQSNLAIRLVVPTLDKTVVLTSPNLNTDEYVNSLYGGAQLVDNIDELIRTIMSGNNVRDWEESWTPPPTTTRTTVTEVPSTTQNTSRIERSLQDSTTILNSTTILETSTASGILSTSTTTEEDDFDKFISGGDDEEEIIPVLDKRAPINLTTVILLNTTVIPANTTVSSKSEVSLYAAHEEPVDGEDLNLAAGSKNERKNNTADPNGHVDGTDLVKRRREIDANLLIYILLLLLIIWLFCIFLCLIWMFYCAKKKKNKLQDEADERAKLLTPFLESHGSSEGPIEPSAPKPSTESSEDEGDDEWKNIKPAKYTDSTVSNQSKSESEKPVEAKAQFGPVEVSEFESMNGDDETHKKSRRERVLNPKRTADLRFD